MEALGKKVYDEVKAKAGSSDAVAIMGAISDLLKTKQDPDELAILHQMRDDLLKEAEEELDKMAWMEGHKQMMREELEEEVHELEKSKRGQKTAEEEALEQLKDIPLSSDEEEATDTKTIIGTIVAQVDAKITEGKKPSSGSIANLVYQIRRKHGQQAYIAGMLNTALTQANVTLKQTSSG